jgi:hypothetical protein
MFFSFFDMAYNYESRKVARTEIEGGFISTASVTDGAQPYETAISHPQYNYGSVIAVEAYDSLEAAKAGHQRWVEAMSLPELPESLIDCRNGEVGWDVPDEDVTYQRID